MSVVLWRSDLFIICRLYRTFKASRKYSCALIVVAYFISTHSSSPRIVLDSLNLPIVGSPIFAFTHLVRPLPFHFFSTDDWTLDDISKCTSYEHYTDIRTQYIFLLLIYYYRLHRLRIITKQRNRINLINTPVPICPSLSIDTDKQQMIYYQQ